MKKHNLGLVVAGALSLAVIPGCIDTFGDDCTVTETCSSGGGGTGDGGGDGDTGGTGTGGKGTGAGDTGGTGGGEETCSPACSGDTPVCDEDAKVCVGCLKDGDCGDDAPLCDTDSNECVGCLETSDCTDASASLCDSSSCAPCVVDDDCSHIDGKDLCDEGACVDCKSEADCGGNVCDPSVNTCTTFPAGDLTACQECVYDAQCQTGQLCVEQSFDSKVIGNFCTWRKDGRTQTALGCFPAGKPFVNTASVTSTDGVEADVCQLRTTSCIWVYSTQQVYPRLRRYHP